MKLKNCPCCGKMQTTKTATFIGRCELRVIGLMFNCKCGSTFAITKETLKARRAQEKKAA